MFKEKFDYKDAHCPSCDYTKDGKILKSESLKYLVSLFFRLIYYLLIFNVKIIINSLKLMNILKNILKKIFCYLEINIFYLLLYICLQKIILLQKF